MSAFALEDGVVYHAYSTYARGLDGLWGMYQWLDRAQGTQRDGRLVAPPRRVQGLSEEHERGLCRRIRWRRNQAPSPAGSTDANEASSTG
ncbi:MAG: DUF899 family protein [Gammaproteobacteria bacterium]